MMKRILCVLMVLLMLVQVIPVPVLAAESGEEQVQKTSDSPVIASGYCGGEVDGTNLTWELTEDGTLTVSGTGPMADWQDSLYTPWYGERSRIKTVIIEENVTAIGSYAFCECDALDSVTIPDSVTAVNSYAFAFCPSLPTIVIPDSVTSIEHGVLRNCDILSSVTLPDGLTTIPGDAFSFCYCLSSVTIPASVTTIEAWAFAQSGLSSVEIPDTVTYIGGAAFENTCLGSVTIPASVTTIGLSAFGTCWNLTSAYFEGNAPIIHNDPFSDCREEFTIYHRPGTTGWSEWPWSEHRIGLTNGYKIMWYNDDGTVLECDEAEKGDLPTYDGATPTKESDAQYHYTFSGWSPEITPVTGDVTYTAQYTKTLRNYKIKWVINGRTYSENFDYGEVPVCNFNTEKQPDSAYTYTFIGWDTEPCAVTGEATYVAQYEREHLPVVTWVNADGTVLETDAVMKGAMPSYDGLTPTKAKDAQYRYTFTGWSPEITPVTGDMTYTAQYEAIARDLTGFEHSIQASFLLENDVIMCIRPQMTGYPEGVQPADIVDRVGLLIWNDPIDEENATYETAQERYPAAAYNEQLGRFEMFTDGIPAKEMADTMAFRCYYLNEDGEYVYSRFVYSYSVKAYAKTRLNAGSASEKALMVAMMNYGAASQVYFSNYNKENPANSILTEEQRNFTWDSALVNGDWTVPAEKEGKLARDITAFMKREISLGLEGAIDYNWRFVITADVAKAEVLVWSEAEYQAAEVLSEENATVYDLPYEESIMRYVFTVKGLPARKMFEPVYICAKVTDYEKNVYYSGVLANCPARYAFINHDNNDEAAANLSRTLILYGDAARAYFG